MRSADAIVDIRLNGLKELEELRSLSAALSVAKAHLEQQDQLLQETDSELEALRREIRSETPTEIELPAEKSTHAWLESVSSWAEARTSALVAHDDLRRSLSDIDEAKSAITTEKDFLSESLMTIGIDVDGLDLACIDAGS